MPFIANECLVPYDADGDGIPEDHWFNVVYNPWRDAEGAVSGVIAVLSDISQLVQSRREVERVNRELEEFAYVASHDLQEPLRMVNAYTQLLVQRLEKLTPEQAQKYAGFIGNGVRRMEQLIRICSPSPAPSSVKLPFCKPFPCVRLSISRSSCCALRSRKRALPLKSIHCPSSWVTRPSFPSCSRTSSPTP